MHPLILLAGALLLGIVLVLALRLGRVQRRERTLGRLLDLADEMETLLNLAQERMRALQAVVGRVPADIAAVAHASLDGGPAVLEAKRDVLQHRLWIQQFGGQAGQRELDTACDALQRARDRLSAQLAELERAGAELAEATDASAEAALREPPALRRDPDAP